MPSFDDSTQTFAAPEDVWMLLYDPVRFPEWWTGIASTTLDGDGDYTMFVDGYPNFPMPQALDARPQDRRVTISCMVSDLVFQWHLEPAGDGGTKISVHVDIPDSEATRLDMQREVIRSSLRKLGQLAAAT
jgi:Polyketide cyclase / dehydrase and lipid transport